MKALAVMLFVCVCSPVFAQAEDDRADVEVTLMAIGDPAGGKLQADSTGCAVVHFLNRSKDPVYLPTAPRSLGKGRVEEWSDASYLSPKQGEDYGYGYRAAHDVAKVKMEFLGGDGSIIHTDSSIQLGQIGLIKPGSWGVSAILFSTPAKPGSYAIRFTFDNRAMSQLSGDNGLDPRPARLVTLDKRLDLPAIPVIEKKVEQGGDREEGRAGR